MRLSWSHSRFIDITCKGLLTRLTIPLYDIKGKLQSVKRVGNDLIVDFVEKPQNFENSPGFKPGIIIKYAIETRDPISLQQADSLPKKDDQTGFNDRYD